MRKKPEKTSLERIPVRQNNKIILLPVAQIVSIVAEGRMLHLSTGTGESYEIDYRLKDLEARLDPAKFVRLSRHALANVEFIRHAEVRSNGTYLVVFKNDRQLLVSRVQSRILRARLFKL